MRKTILSLLFLSLLFSCGNKKQEAVTTSDIHPEWSYNATIYEVNVRQYTPEGTFEAFAQHIPRLKELGVDILWFMPIQSIGEKDRKGGLGSYYSIRDYKEVNPEFGTLDDFKKVVKLAHDNGMKVILDWVANHTSRDAVWLQTHKDWYVTDSVGSPVAPFDWTDVAKLNYENKDMRAEMIKDMQFWVREADIDGFRCDVAAEVPTDFWQTAKDSLRALKPSLFLLAEAEEPELNEAVFDSFYAWKFHHKMNQVAQGKDNVDSLRVALQEIQSKFAKHAMPMFFTSNHDENSWNGTEFERMGDAAKAFAALTYMMPGIPLIYNGQESGFNRRLLFFDKDSIDWKDAGNFARFYAQLNAFRKDNPALSSPERSGSFEELPNDKSQQIWAFKRVKDSNEVICIFNLTNKPQNVTFNDKLVLSGYASLEGAQVAESVTQLTLKPWEYRVYAKK